MGTPAPLTLGVQVLRTPGCVSLPSGFVHDGGPSSRARRLPETGHLSTLTPSVEAEATLLTAEALAGLLAAPTVTAGRAALANSTLLASFKRPWAKRLTTLTGA